MRESKRGRPRIWPEIKDETKADLRSLGLALMGDEKQFLDLREFIFWATFGGKASCLTSQSNYWLTRLESKTLAKKGIELILSRALAREDYAFFETISILGSEPQSYEYTAQQKIREAYDYLCASLARASAMGIENVKLGREARTISAQVLFKTNVLSSPSNREPSIREIQSFIRYESFHFEPSEAPTREQVRNEASKNGWNLANSRDYPGLPEVAD